MTEFCLQLDLFCLVKARLPVIDRHAPIHWWHCLEEKSVSFHVKTPQRFLLVVVVCFAFLTFFNVCRQHQLMYIHITIFLCVFCVIDCSIDQNQIDVFVIFFLLFSKNLTTYFFVKLMLYLG